MLEGLFYQNDILGAGMRAAQVRNQVINNNISNADTPNYKRKYVVFEDVLKGELKRNEKFGERDLSHAVASVRLDNSTYEYRIDGNGVDLQAEMVALYENAARYDVMVQGITHNYKKINLVSQIK